MGLGIQSKVPLHKVGRKWIKTESVKPGKPGKVKGPERRLSRWGSCSGRHPGLTHGVCGPGHTQDSAATGSAQGKGPSSFSERDVARKLSYQCSEQTNCLTGYTHPFTKYSEYQLCAHTVLGPGEFNLYSSRKKQKM